MKAKQIFLVGACVLGLLASTANAGYYYEAVTTTDSEDDRGDSQMTVAVWAEGDAAKIEFSQGDETGFFGPGTYMLTKDGGELMYLVNTEDKTYAEFNLGEMMNFASQAMQGMGNMFRMEFTDVYSEKLGEGPGMPILGYSTKHLRFRSGYTMRMAVMGMKQEQKVDMEQEMWTNDSIATPAFDVWMRPDKRMTGMFEGLDEMMEAEFSKVEGVPLKSVTHMTMTNKKGRATRSTSTTEVTDLRQENIPDSTFEIPADYTETQLMPDMSEMEGMQGDEAEGDEEGRRRPRLRDLMKRRREG